MATKGLFKNTIIVGFITLISRISGLIRDFFIAKYLGAGKFSDCFLVAFKVPNLFRSIFAEGAFNSAFVPIFSGIIAEDPKQRAIQFCKNIFAILFYMLLIFTLIAEVYMPFMIDVFAPGFSDAPEKYQLSITLARITFPFLLSIALTSFFGSILNTFGRFEPYALTPIILNTCIIFALVLFSRTFPTSAHAASWGVCVSGIIQLVFLWYISKKYGFGVISFKISITPKIREFFRKIIPGILGAGIYHLNVMIGSIFASDTNGAVSWIYYADRLNQLPLGVIGIALATVLLPSLSKEVKKHNINKTFLIFNQSIKFASLLIIPSAFALFAISYPLIQLVFERGAFTNSDTFATSNILQILCLSLPALVFTKLFANTFYARNDTKTPMVLAFITMLFNLFFTFIFNSLYGYIGIVVSITITNWINTLLLYFTSYFYGYMRMYKRILSDLLKITITSIFMALIIYFGVMGLSAELSLYPLWLNLLGLFLILITGSLFYTVAILLSGVTTVQQIKSILKK